MYTHDSGIKTGGSLRWSNCCSFFTFLPWILESGGRGVGISPKVPECGAQSGSLLHKKGLTILFSVRIGVGHIVPFSCDPRQSVSGV